MNAYAVAHVQSAQPSPEILDYPQHVDETLAPYGGRFLVHGDTGETREGPFTGNVIVIQFPDRDSANGWYDSPAYQQIRPLRTRNTTGWVILVNGVEDNHHATDILTTDAQTQPTSANR